MLYSVGLAASKAGERQLSLYLIGFAGESLVDYLSLCAFREDIPDSGKKSCPASVQSQTGKT
jgi:hypothetical protein